MAETQPDSETTELAELAEPGRYVLVDKEGDDKTIRGGPLLYREGDQYDPGEGLKLMLESEAQEAGYSHPVVEGSEN